MEPRPTAAVLVWRKLCAILKAWRSAGDIPGMLVVFIPRLTVSYMVVTVAQMARAIARVVGTPSSYEPKANLRILIITDYMPPQTHGCAGLSAAVPPALPPALRRARSLSWEPRLGGARRLSSRPTRRAARIAIRFRNYIDNMRLRGHEVQVRGARAPH